MIKKDRRPEMAANIRKLVATTPRRKTPDSELLVIAIRKLRLKLFAKYSACELGILLVSEKVLPLIRVNHPDFADKYGGLEYLLIHQVCTKLCVQHQEKDIFKISLFYLPFAGSERVKKAREARFQDLDWMVLKIIISAAP